MLTHCHGMNFKDMRIKGTTCLLSIRHPCQPPLSFDFQAMWPASPCVTDTSLYFSHHGLAGMLNAPSPSVLFSS